MTDPTRSVELSVIVPVGVRQAVPEEIHTDYRGSLDALGISYELVYVLDGHRSEFQAGLRRLLKAGERFTVISLTRSFGEATALMAGFAHARGQAILTLPAYHQIEGLEIAKLIEALQGADVAVGWRHPRAGGPFEALRRSVFHGLLAIITKARYHDLGCSARAFKRQVLEEIQLYGDQHRFFAVLAERQGFRVREIQLRQSPRDRRERRYQVRDYARNFLDIFTVFFLVRFTKKPLRFFGMLGVGLFLLGGLLLAYLIVERLFFGEALADRPALLLGSLMVVLGMQLFALGLLGELIIFTHARQIKDYQIAEIVESRSPLRAIDATERDAWAG